MKKFLIWLGMLVVGVLVFAVIGQFVGSYVFIRLAKAPVSPGVFVLWDLYKNSQGPGGGIWVMWQFKVGVFLAGALPLVPVVMSIAILFSRSKRELHGSARFATPSEIAKADLLKNKYEKPDITIGKYKGKYLRWGGDEFAFLAAPTRSGKGVSIVIPNCLHYRDSMVVCDPKLENFQKTAGYREAHGQEVFLLCPSTTDYRSHRWNALTYVKRHPDFAPGSAFTLANLLYPVTPDMGDVAKFFAEMAQKLFVGLCLYLIETEGKTKVVPSLAALLRLTTPANGQPLAAWIKETAQNTQLSEPCRNNLFSYVANSGGNTGPGIVSSLTAPLSVFSDPIIEAITSGDDFDLRDVRRKRMTIYLGIKPDDFPKFSRFINLFFSQLISVNCDELPEHNPALKYQCLVLMDEFGAMGRVDIVKTGSAFIAGYGLRLLAVFQSKSQLHENYGENGTKSLLSNFACQIAFTTRDNDESKEYSELIGDGTVYSKNNSTGKGGRSISEAKGDGAGHRRAVMLPQEVRAMPLTDCIINLRGTPTMYVQKVRYYDDPVFRQRLGFSQPMIPSFSMASSAKAGAVNNKPVSSTETRESVPEHELDATPLESLANKDELMQVVIAALRSEDSSPEYQENLKQAVARAWQENGTRAFEQVLGTT